MKKSDAEQPDENADDTGSESNCEWMKEWRNEWMDEWQRYVRQEIIEAEDKLRVLDILSSLESMEASNLIPSEISYDLFDQIQKKNE